MADLPVADGQIPHAKVKELDIHEVFTALRREENIYAGVFNSDDYPYVPADPVRCNYFSTMFFTSGTGFLVVDNVEYAVQPGRIFVFNDRQVIGWGYYEHTIGLVVAFTAHVALSLHLQFNKPYIDLPEQELPFYTTLFEHLISQFRIRDQHSQAILQAGAGYLYAGYARHTSAPDSNDKLISALRSLICANFALNPSIEDLALSLQVSPKELNKRCLQKIGLTGKQYLLELKLTEAKRLLAFTDLNAAEIAFHTGFEDPSYFTRLFRKKNGMTPSDFKKKYQKESQKS